MSTLKFSEKDASGKIEVACYSEEAPTAQSLFKDWACVVPDDYVVIGGGATGTTIPSGHLLTASYPQGPPNGPHHAWLASSKDHHLTSPHKLITHAIGLKVIGWSPDQLRDNLFYDQKKSHFGPQNWPEGTAGFGKDDQGSQWTLISGGFHVDFHGAGNLATGSLPIFTAAPPTMFTGKWLARSKDHRESDPCRIETFAVYIKSNLDGIGRVESTVESESSWDENRGPYNHPSASARLPAGYVTTGIGGNAETYGAGQLLFNLSPIAGGATAGSKDHQASSPGTVTAFAVGIRIAQ